VQYGDVLLLSCGAVIVSSAGHAVQASDTRVTPVGGPAKFEMINRDGKLKINVQSGTVRVSSDQTTMLSAGQSTERDSEGCPLAAILLKSTPAAAGGRGKWIALVAAGGGAAAAGIFIAGRKPTSPSGP
jgi:ferric-dicitrate binding protein FerR (iron transport regulator)